ncbi:hypothetical protein CDV55_100058, partial [Aspergillus turcosus]
NDPFSQQIESLSKRSSKDYVYPRPDLINLSRYLSNDILQRPADHLSDTSFVASEESTTDSFAVVHNITNGGCTRFHASSTGLHEFNTYNAPRSPILLFLRGFSSAPWLNAIGKTHRASPELYRRHLDYGPFMSGGRELFSSPSLPSSSAHVFQLMIPTVCTRSADTSSYEPEDLQQARRQESEAMAGYFRQLRTKAKVADSVVRSCHLLGRQVYVLEQRVSVEVGAPENNWRAIIWLDTGRDLSESLPGPWNPPPSSLSWQTYFCPVIVHHADDTFDGSYQSTRQKQLHATGTTPSRSVSAFKSNDKWRAAQNIAHLPFQYGSRLDKELASRDALYALSELFSFAASAQLQYLNLLETRIKHELSFVGTENDVQYHSLSLVNLKYIKTLLTSNAQGVAETISLFKNRHSLHWPRVDNAPTAEKAACLLLADFEYLLQRSEMLSRECEQGMATLANSSVLEESRRSAEMNVSVQSLTIIGAIFVPLSFVCSVWGMNFKELGSGSNPLWMWAATAVPVSLLTYLQNQMAVFGVRGKVETQAHSLLDFQIRYTVVPETEFPFRLHAVVTGPAGDDYDGQAGGGGRDELEIVQSGLHGQEQLTYFRDAVYSLTQRVQSVGLEATIRSFMTPGNTPSSVVSSLDLPNGTTVLNGVRSHHGTVRMGRQNGLM